MSKEKGPDGGAAVEMAAGGGDYQTATGVERRF